MFKTKKSSIITSSIIVLILVVLGVVYYEYDYVPAEHACAIDFLQTFVFSVPSSTSETTVGETLLSQFLTAYEHVPQCATLGITDFSVTSVGKPTQVGTDFTIPVTFDVKPLSASKTLWATASTTWDGGWVRDEAITLGIHNVSTTTTSSSYQLILP